jgi:DNA polymerase elongation subunit (family B)
MDMIEFGIQEIRYMLNKSSNFTITPLGKQKVTVYDIEVEDNHNFFANDILVHNSLYFTLKPFVDKLTKGKEYPSEKLVDIVDEFFEKMIQPQIDKGYNELREYMNAYEQQMFMAREVIADKGFWRAKKNYALNVYDSEGVRYTKPKLKIMGLESVKSSTPEICRDAFQESVRLILQDDELALQKFIGEFNKSFMTRPFEEIAFPRGVSDIEKWKDATRHYKSGTPFHVKGALAYNELVNKHGLKSKYREIKNGDKIKLVYLKNANPTIANVMAFPDVLPPEFKLDKYVDRVLQYKKSFLHPIETVLNIIGWSAEKRNTLF